MADVYRSATPPVPSSEDGVVVIHCSDPRYQLHFQDFLRTHLGLTSYALIAIPGGPQPLTLVEYLPKFAWSGWRWMKFLVTLTRPRRIIMMAHDDCRWYLDNRFAEVARVRARQIDDLRRVRAAFVERFGSVDCDLFYARLEGTSAVFERIDEHSRAGS